MNLIEHLSIIVRRMAKKDTQIKEPVSRMAQLLEKVDFTPKVFFKGEKVEGTIVNKVSDSYLIDIGAKSEGIIPIKELEEEQKGVKVGSKVSINVAQPENDSGTIILTVKAATKEKAWQNLEKMLDNQEIIDVKAIEVNRGGLIVDYQETRGFVPSSHLVTNAREAVGKKIKVKPIEVNRTYNKLVFSEKEVSGDSLPKIDLPFKVGDVLDVKVSKILPFGLLASLKGGGEGLVHISEISWTRVENLQDIFKTTQDLKVKVISIDSANGRVNLSIKQLEKDPWQEAAKKYKVGQQFEKKVSRTASYGIFVGLEEGIEGLLHSSKIPYGVNFKPGDKIKISIDLFNTEQRRVALRMAAEEKLEAADEKPAKTKTKPKETKATKETKSEKKTKPTKATANNKKT